MNAQQREEVFRRLSIAIPNPTTELNYSTVYELLVAVILSAQATDKSVNIATAELFKRANTPETIINLGIDRLQECIKTIGLYRTKAKNILAMSRILIDQYAGQVPQSRVALEALPGVGRKTANVILNTAYGEPTIAVDTHLFRLANRIGIAKGKTPLAVELGLLKKVPKAYLKDAHHLLILHGRYICRDRAPLCDACVIKDLCEYKAKEMTA
jgi:endonuclease III